MLAADQVGEELTRQWASIAAWTELDLRGCDERKQELGEAEVGICILAARDRGRPPRLVGC